MRKKKMRMSNDELEVQRIDRFINPLKMMFSLQRQFQERIGRPVSDKPDPVAIVYQVTSIVGEIGEILEEYQHWKPWRKNPPEYDRSSLLYEVVDLWHFVINLTLYLGFNEDELFSAFIEKNKVNFERQEAGY